MTIKLYSFGCR